MSIDLAPRWYVVQTQPRAETKAMTQLGRQGFASYLPRYLKRRRHARRTEIVAMPLFPRYLFVSVDMGTQRWRSIQSTLGVSRIVCNGDVPACVDDRVIDGLRGREDEAGFIRLCQRPKFRPGDKLRVIDGIFGDNFGLFEEMTENERVTILLDLLGRKVRVRLDADLVTAA